MDDLLLKDYRPRTMVVTEEHVVEKPKFPAVDANNLIGLRTEAFGRAT